MILKSKVYTMYDITEESFKYFMNDKIMFTFMIFVCDPSKQTTDQLICYLSKSIDLTDDLKTLRLKCNV